jgi:hypothetical protein
MYEDVLPLRAVPMYLYTPPDAARPEGPAGRCLETASSLPDSSLVFCSVVGRLLQGKMVPGVPPDVAHSCNLAKVLVGNRGWCTLAAMHPPRDGADLNDSELLATAAMPAAVLRQVASEVLVRLVPRQPLVGARGRSPPRDRDPPRDGDPDEVPHGDADVGTGAGAGAGAGAPAGKPLHSVVVWARDMRTHGGKQHLSVVRVETIAYPGSVHNWARVTVEVRGRARSKSTPISSQLHTMWLDFPAKTRQVWLDILFASREMEAAMERAGAPDVSKGFNPVEALRMEEPLVEDAFAVLQARSDSDSDLDSDSDSDTETEALEYTGLGPIVGM